MTVSICAGTCEDDCPHTCADFSAGTFSLALDDNGEYNLSASGTDWSIDQCGNYAAADASTPVADVYFTADCTMTSTAYSGSVLLSLSLASLADDGSAAGTVTLLGTNVGVDFFASVTGSVADTSTLPALSGSLDAFSSGSSDDCAVAAFCGDSTCDASEDCSSCPADCGACPPDSRPDFVEAVLHRERENFRKDKEAA